MVITEKELIPECSCGREHGLALKKAVIARGAVSALPDALGEYGLPGRFAVIYDENTFAALDGKRPAAAREVVLDPAGLHANEKGVAAAEEKLGDEPLLIAAGAGTVHDITRYIAAKRGVPFVSIPTAASVDGFAASVAAMTLGGFKVTSPAVAPGLVFADSDVIAAAPRRLTASGFGDVLGKYVSLADWEIAHVLTGEYYCGGIAGLMKRAVSEAADASSGIADGDTEAYEKLMKALILSGAAMQLAGNSRPASGAEHHISHLMELGMPWLPPVDALHGEKVGVGTLLALRAYARWRVQKPDAVAKAISAWTSPSEETLRAEFGGLTESILDENADDCLSRVTADSVLSNWDAVKAILKGLPPAGEVEAMLKRVGGKTTLAELGVGEELEGRILLWSPFVRNRLTFMRLMNIQSALSRFCCCGNMMM